MKAPRFRTITIAHYETQLAGLRSSMLSELHAKERENAMLRRQVDDATLRLQGASSARSYLLRRLERDDDAKRADRAMLGGLASAALVALALVGIVGIAHLIWVAP